MVLLGLLALSLLLWLWIGAGNLRLILGLDRLPDVDPVMPEGRPWPSLSVVAPARNEEKGVEAAARSLLAQDYPDLEVVFVDDRSEDATGAILDRIAAEKPGLTVVHARELPPGWLGKNHACHRGAARAGGRWILFTDGDVCFAPDALRRSVAWAEARGLGHAVALPLVVAPNFLERSFIAGFSVFLGCLFRIWALKRPRTSAFIGIGAFNLVRREEYLRVGGHGRLRMEVVDDAKLGMILRRSGVRQGAVDSGGLVKVRWQAGFLATLRGLMKNAFAAAEWSWLRLGLGAALIALLGVLPAFALAFGPPEARPLAGTAVGLAVLLCGGSAWRASGGSGLEGLLFLPVFLCLIGVMLASAIAATLRGGIRWRSTLYPLADLRRGCVRERDWPARGAVGWEEKE